MADDNISSKTAKSKVSIVKNTAQSSNLKSLVNFNKSMSRVRMRRASYGFSGILGIRPAERVSQVAMEYKRPPLLFLPTYQLDPTVRFQIQPVEAVIEEVLDEYFTGHKYNVQESPTLAIRVAGEVMRRVKALNFNRYRVIAICTVGQRRAQSYNNAVSFIWDHERDNYVDTHRHVTTAFIHVTTFGIYLD